MALNAALLITDIKTRISNELGINFGEAVQTSAMEIMIDELINHLITFTEVETTLNQSLQTIFQSGTPVPTDGGAALKTAWTVITAAQAKDKASGTIK
ncbi:MAG: hypothetical protein R3209_06295 [Salinimicrobium sediminis]|nr:hypothetical protein [Salinimicrobium sediminis]